MIGFDELAKAGDRKRHVRPLRRLLFKLLRPYFAMLVREINAPGGLENVRKSIDTLAKEHLSVNFRLLIDGLAKDQLALNHRLKELEDRELSLSATDLDRIGHSIEKLTKDQSAANHKLKEIEQRFLDMEQLSRPQIDRQITSAADVQRVDQAAIRKVLSLFTPCAVVGYSKVRIGQECDGGYVVIDDFQGVRSCYSFGLGSEVSWETDMAERGIKVFQYDHTIASPDQRNGSFHFHRLAIATVDGCDVRTLQTLLEENDHLSDKDMILKLDVEGMEWDVFEHAPSHVLGHFKQIVCEFHGLTGLRDPCWYERAKRVLLKLASSHAPVHVHGNNHAAFDIVEGIPVPDVLEVTYVRRSSYALETNTESFPTILDRPNNAYASDIYLGRFEF